MSLLLAIYFVLPYVSFIVLVLGLTYRVIKWSSLPLQLRWELYPIPHKVNGLKGKIEELKETLKEMLFIVRVWRGKKKLWLFTWTFHIGLYLMLIWFILLLLGAIVKSVWRIEVSMTSQNTLGLILGYLIDICGVWGSIILAFGVTSLIIFRTLDKGMRMYSTAIDYLNLILIASIVWTGIAIVYPKVLHYGYVYYSFDKIFIGFDKVFQNAINQMVSLITFNPSILYAIDILREPLMFIHQVLLYVFLAYLPFSKMVHFIGKYFTYHKVIWDDKPGLEGPLYLKYWGFLTVTEPKAHLRFVTSSKSER